MEIKVNEIDDNQEQDEHDHDDDNKMEEKNVDDDDDDDAEEGEILEDGEIADDDEQEQNEQEIKKEENKAKDKKEKDKSKDKDKDKKRDEKSDSKRERRKSNDRDKERRSSERERRSNERDRRSSERDKKSDKDEDREKRRRERERKRRRNSDDDDERRDKRTRRTGNWESFDVNSNFNDRTPPYDRGSSSDEDEYEEMLKKMASKLNSNDLKLMNRTDGLNRMHRNEKEDLFKNMLMLLMKESKGSLDPEITRWRDRKERIRERRRRERTPGPTGTRASTRAERIKEQTYKTICKFYLEGKCHKGNDCPFSHDGAPIKRKEICKFYLQGFCGKADSCLFMHGEFPCKFFHTGAECYSGENCRFSHSPLTPDTREILRNYLDSGELPDVPKPYSETNNSSSQEKQEKTHVPNQTEPLVSTTIVTTTTENQSPTVTTVSTTYVPIKPVQKRYAILGDPTEEMKKSYYTWIWQQEMKELELAYVGNKRNLFCIEKQFAITEKPPTPRMEDDEEEVEAQIRSYYRDTLGVDPEDKEAIKNEEERLLLASAHDEDLRTLMAPKQEPNEQLNKMNSDTNCDANSTENHSHDIKVKKEKEDGLSDSDDDADDDVMKNVMKNLKEKPEQPKKEGMIPLDITKMLNQIRQSSRQQTASASHHADFWQNMFNTTKGSSSPTQQTSSSDSRRFTPRDPRLKRTEMSPSSSESVILKICDSSVHIEYKMMPIDVQDIDYTCYASMYQTDSHLKNDPRLQKFFAKLPNAVIDHLSRIVPPPLKSVPITPLSVLKTKIKEEKEKQEKNIEESIKSNSPPLPPLPPLMISPTKSGPTSSGLKPPTPPPMMTPLELISSKPFN